MNLGIRQIYAYLLNAKIYSEMIFVNQKTDIVEMAKHLLSSKIVAFSVFTDEMPLARKLSAEIMRNRKKKHPIIVFGGHHPTLNAGECLEFCDCVVRGEGEETLLDICRDSQKIVNIKNISYLAGESIVENPLRELVSDLDELPFPNYDDLNTLATYHIMTSKGCPFNCSYCYNNAYRKMYAGKGKYIRFKSIPYVIKELERAKQMFPDIKTVEIMDDNFFMRKIEEIMLFAEEYKSKISLPFFCLANPTYVTGDKLQVLKSAGLERIQIGIQTGSEKINYSIYDRKIPNKKILECAYLCKKYSIAVFYDLIFNNPYESNNDVKKTLQILLRIPKPFHLQGFNLIFYPNADIAMRALHDGYILPRTSEHEEVNTIQNDNNSPLRFSNSIGSPFWKTHYSTSSKKIKLNNLIALSQFLPNYIIRLLSILPGDVLQHVRYWLKIKKKLIPEEEYLLRLLSSSKVE